MKGKHRPTSPLYSQGTCHILHYPFDSRYAKLAGELGREASKLVRMHILAVLIAVITIFSPIPSPKGTTEPPKSRHPPSSPPHHMFLPACPTIKGKAVDLHVKGQSKTAL